MMIDSRSAGVLIDMYTRMGRFRSLLWHVKEMLLFKQRTANKTAERCTDLFKLLSRCYQGMHGMISAHARRGKHIAKPLHRRC
jgi:hypothetical protein